MYEFELFLGVEITPKVNTELTNVSPYIRQTFIKNGSDYLHTAQAQGKDFLGKKVGDLIESSQMAAITANVESLLKRIIGYTPSPVLLLAIPK